MTNELAASIAAVAWAYVRANRRIPDHVIADLYEVARADGVAQMLRGDARRLLRLEAA